MSRFAALKESAPQKHKAPETQELKTTELKQPKERPDRVFAGGYYSKVFRSTLNRRHGSGTSLNRNVQLATGRSLK